MKDEKILVMIAGLSEVEGKGKMARLVAEAVIARPDMQLYGNALAEVDGSLCLGSNGSQVVKLFKPISHRRILCKALREGVDLIVDFTLPLSPQAIIPTVALYCDIGVPFVLGTTGGNRALLTEAVSVAKISAVIATNMSPEIVLFQQMLRLAATNFPGALSGHRLLIQESHQPDKKDVSGTAIGLLDYFRTLGMLIEKEDIISERRPIVQQVEWGLRPQEIGGHADHIYTILSPDSSVMLQFKHTVRGRQTYVDGTLKAIRFLAKRNRESGHIWSMADVLK